MHPLFKPGQQFGTGHGAHRDLPAGFQKPIERTADKVGGAGACQDSRGPGDRAEELLELTPAASAQCHRLPPRRGLLRDLRRGMLNAEPRALFCRQVQQTSQFVQGFTLRSG